MLHSGKSRRLHRILATSPSYWLPIDDSLLNGPSGGLKDLSALTRREFIGEFTAILCFRGFYRAHVSETLGVAIIENISASTTRRDHTRKVIVSSVEGAIRRGADAVAYHLNLTSEFESESLRNLGLLSDECEKSGIPLVVIAYPRRTKADGTDENYDELANQNPEEYADLVAHAVRAASELGADVIKTKFPAKSAFLSKIKYAANGVPFVIAGGSSPVNDENKGMTTDELATESIRNGAAGICFGRRIYNSQDPIVTIRTVKDHVRCIEQKSGECR